MNVENSCLRFFDELKKFKLETFCSIINVFTVTLDQFHASSLNKSINFLKGSYDVAKKNIILCIWCNAMRLCALRLKKHIIFHILYIIVAPLCSAFLNTSIFTKLIVLRSEVCSDWPASQCVVIGWIPQACDGNVKPLTVLWCRVPARQHKNNKTHYKRGICCIQWGPNYWL